jgi:hypothetical protein
MRTFEVVAGPASVNPAALKSARVPVQAKAFGSRWLGFRFTG